MLDGLLGRGYSAKCRPLIKQTKSRIDVIRRKRNATLKFLKKDIADLLANGLDINAYGRAEGLVAEIILSSCYDFVDKSCDIVLNHLSVMQKVSECPEDCREAASCLMFAAARFSDLPELRDLRQIFHDRYANALELYVNQTFVENLTSKPPSLEKKVQLMKEIAIEFSIKWDCKAFEQRMSTPPGFLKDYKTNVSSAKSRDRPTNNGHRLESSREAFVSKRDDKDFPLIPEVPRNGCKPRNGSDESVPNRLNYDYTFQGRQEYTIKTKNNVMKEVGLSGSSYEKRLQNPEGGFKMHDSGTGNTTPQKEREQTFSSKSYAASGHDEVGVKSAVSKPSKFNNHDNRHEDGNAMGKVHEDRKSKLKPLHQDDRHDTDKLMGKVHQDRTPRLSPFHHDDGYDADKLLGNVHEDRTPRLNPSKVTNHDAGKAIGKVHEDGIPRMKPIHHDDHPVDKKMGKVHQDRTPRLSSLQHHDGHDADKLMGKVHEDRTPGLNPLRNVAVPPPYVKPSSKSKDSVPGANVILSHVNLNIGRECVPKIPSVHSRDAAATPSVDSGIDHSNKEKQDNGHVRWSRRKHEKDLCNPVDATGFPLPKPRSMRRRHSRSRSGQDAVDDSVEEPEIVTRRLRSRRRDDSRRGLQILFDDEQHKDDAEERMIDKLLIHYSKKPSSKDPTKEKGKAKSRHAHPVAGTSTGEPAGGGRRRDRQDELSEVVSPPARSISLPREHSGTLETTKVYARAASFQADRSAEARHVHPKLPDYDNLAAQFAALRG